MPTRADRPPGSLQNLRRLRNSLLPSGGSDILIVLRVLSAIQHDVARTTRCRRDQPSVSRPVGHVVPGLHH
jgi:hypothetical protein